MNVRTDRKDDVLLLYLEGDECLDCSTAASVRTTVLEKIDGSSDVVMDLSRVQFVDSAGLGVLITVYKATRRKGRQARFAGARPEVHHIMEVIHLNRILELSPNVASAVRELEALQA
jgi:anti-sigma B factor antagonist